jgi:hypothetical protein
MRHAGETLERQSVSANCPMHRKLCAVDSESIAQEAVAAHSLCVVPREPEHNTTRTCTCKRKCTCKRRCTCKMAWSSSRNRFDIFGAGIACLIEACPKVRRVRSWAGSRGVPVVPFALAHFLLARHYLAPANAWFYDHDGSPRSSKCSDPVRAERTICRDRSSPRHQGGVLVAAE